MIGFVNCSVNASDNDCVTNRVAKKKEEKRKNYGTKAHTFDNRHWFEFSNVILVFTIGLETRQRTTNNNLI